MVNREEKKVQTRQALASAAIELFTERGYDDVTVEQIAESVGVSRRTAFRYFVGKDDLVMEHPNQWMAVFEASLDAHQDAVVSERLHIAAHAVAAHVEADPEPVKQLFALAFSHPAILASYARNSQEWIERVIAEASLPDQTADDALRVSVLASAYMGVVNSVCMIWAQSGGSMAELLDAGFASLDAGLTSLDN